MGADVEAAQVVEVEEPKKPTLESVRAEVLKEHGYVTKEVDADGPDSTVVFVCECGETGEADDREALARVVDHHLDKVIRRAFNNTEFEGEVGTQRLRGFEKRYIQDM